jgi:hypothetical protein
LEESLKGTSESL